VDDHNTAKVDPNLEHLKLSRIERFVFFYTIYVNKRACDVPT
jgi:hypothetical protein